MSDKACCARTVEALPVIDACRQGVRESLENQTMAVAESVASLISRNLRHANGLPVECVFVDVRTYWSPDAITRVAGVKTEGPLAGGVIHLINSGSAALDGTGQQSIHRKPALKPYWEIAPAEVKKCLRATTWYQRGNVLPLVQD